MENNGKNRSRKLQSESFSVIQHSFFLMLSIAFERPLVIFWEIFVPILEIYSKTISVQVSLRISGRLTPLKRTDFLDGDRFESC